MLLISWGLGIYTNKTVPKILRQRKIAHFLKTKNCRGCELDHLNLSHGDYQNSDFTASRLSDVDFSYSDFSGSNFCSAAISGNFYRMKCQGCKITDDGYLAKDLRGVDFTNATISNFGFDDSNLQDAIFTNAKIKSITFSNSNVSGLTFENADFTGADFYKADMQNTTFQNCNFKNATLLDANMQGANFMGSNVTMEQIKTASNYCDVILPNGQKLKCEDKKQKN